MIRNLQKIFVLFCKFWKAFAPMLASLYLVLWVVQFFYYEDTFKKLDFLFGAFPNWINSIYPTPVDLFGIETHMGYIHGALFVMISFLFLVNYEKSITKLELSLKKKDKELEIRKNNQIKKEEIIKKNPYIPNLTHFFGLLELKFDSSYNENVDLEKLKIEYTKLLVSKLQEDFPSVKFGNSTKVFIISEEFSIFDSFLSRLVELVEVFKEINNSKNIKTSLLLSFEAGSTNSNPKYTSKLLQKLNNIKHYNKILIADKFLQKYKQQKARLFQIIPSGLAKIEMENFTEIDVEISFLKKIY